MQPNNSKHFVGPKKTFSHSLLRFYLRRNGCPYSNADSFLWETFAYTHTHTSKLTLIVSSSSSQQMHCPAYKETRSKRNDKKIQIEKTKGTSTERENYCCCGRGWKKFFFPIGRLPIQKDKILWISKVLFQKRCKP